MPVKSFNLNELRGRKSPSVTAYVQKESREQKGYRHRFCSKGSDRVFKRDKGIILSPAEREAEEASALFLESEERINREKLLLKINEEYIRAT